MSAIEKNTRDSTPTTEQEDDALTEALKQSFPASDPLPFSSSSVGEPTRAAGDDRDSDPVSTTASSARKMSRAPRHGRSGKAKRLIG